MVSPRGIRAGQAFVELFADDSRLVRGLKRAHAKLKAFGRSVQAIGDGMRDVGLRVMGLGMAVLAPLAGAAKAFASTGDALAKMSKRTGVSVEALSELGFAAGRSGTSMEGLETGLRRMQRVIVDAATGSKEAKDALALLGLSVADLSALAPEDQFKLIADRLAAIPNPTLRAAAAMEIFGRSGTDLLPLVEKGAAGIAALQEEARRLGLTISTREARAAEAFNDVLGDLWTTVRRGVFAVGAALAPTLSDLAVRIRDLVVRATEWVKKNEGLIVSALKLAAAATAGGAALAVLGTVVSGLGGAITGFGTILGGAATVLGLVGAALGALLSPVGLVIAAVAALGGYVLYATGAAGKALDWLGEKFEALKGFALEAYRGIADALAAGDIGLAAKILWLTLKVAWEKGVAWLKGYWLDWKKAFLDTATDAFYGVIALWAQLKAKLATMWNEMRAMLKTVASVVGGVVRLKVHEFEYRREGEALKGKRARGEITEEEFQREWQALAERTKARRQQIVGETDTALADTDKELQERLTGIEEEKNAALVDVSEKAADARRKHAEEHAADLEKSEADLAKAREEWEAAIAEAAGKRKAREAEGPPGAGEFEALPVPDLAGLSDALGRAADRIVAVQGTFSAMVAGRIGVGGVAERTARATEETAKNTGRLVDEATMGEGLVFD